MAVKVLDFLRALESIPGVMVSPPSAAIAHLLLEEGCINHNTIYIDQNDQERQAVLHVSQSECIWESPSGNELIEYLYGVEGGLEYEDSAFYAKGPDAVREWCETFITLTAKRAGETFNMMPF